MAFVIPKFEDVMKKNKIPSFNEVMRQQPQSIQPPSNIQTTKDYNQQWEQDHPIGANLRKLNPLYWLVERTGALGDTISRASETAGDMATFGASSGLKQKAAQSEGKVYQKTDTGNKALNVGADITGGLLGLLGGRGQGLENPNAMNNLITGSYATGGKLAEKGFNFLTKNVNPTSKAGNLALNLGKRATTGLGAGITYGALEQLGQDKSLGEKAIDTGKEALLFGLGDAALSGIGAGIKNLRNLKSTSKNINLSKLDNISSIKEVASTTDNLAYKPTMENPLDSFRKKINRSPKTETTNFADKFNKLRTQFVDDLAPLEKLEKNIKGKIGSAENSLYKTARLFRGTPTKANEIVRTQLSPIIKNIESKGYSYKDLGDYALAMHAKDVNAKGINSGFKDAEIDAVINKFGTPEMEAARQELLKINNNLLQELADSQVISQDLVKALNEKHPNYMPLFRAFDDNKVEFKQAFSKSLANANNPLKVLKGSQREVIDPIESMVKNIFQITNTAERNKVALQLSDLAKQDSGNFVRKLGKSEEVGRKNVVSVMENGKKVQYEVDPDVYKTLLNLDKESSNFLIKVLSKPASVLRAGATLTPEFSLRNPIRDVVQAFVTSKSGFTPMDFIYGLTQSMLKGRTFKVGGKEYKAPGDLYNQWLQDNGGFGNIISMDRKVHQEALKEVLQQPTSKKFTNIVSGKSLIDVLRKITDMSESATKLGEYRAALRSGTSRQEAAYRSRDIMDFSRAGSSIREANKVIAFLNANIQGKSKILRSIQDDPKGVMLRSLKSITLPTIGITLAQQYMSNDEQKRTIEDAPDWLKNNFWLLPIPGTDQVARIPKPFDLSPVFANMPERYMDYLIKNDKQAFDNFARDTFKSYSIPVMITGLLPFVEGMANYSFFREGPIIPQRENNIMLKDQFDINTTETAKGIANVMSNLTGEEGMFKNFSSPRIVDNTIRGVTAGLGTYATTGIDKLLDTFGVIDKPEKPTNLLNQEPLLRAFLVNQGSTGKSTDQLYNLRDKLTRMKGSSKNNKEPFKDNWLLNFVNNKTSDIGKLSSRIREIQNDHNLDGETKRKMIDELNKRRNDIAINAMRIINNKK